MKQFDYLKVECSDASGTSFHRVTISATVANLRIVLGEPSNQDNNGDDKTNFEWTRETKQGEVFTVYDWKEYRPIDENEVIEWHIGSKNPITSYDALAELTNASLNMHSLTLNCTN